MFGSSFPPVDCRRAHVLFTLFVFVWHIVVFNTYCIVLCVLFCFSSTCVPCVASLSGLFFIDCPFSIFQLLFISIAYDNPYVCACAISVHRSLYILYRLQTCSRLEYRINQSINQSINLRLWFMILIL